LGIFLHLFFKGSVVVRRWGTCAKAQWPVHVWP